MKTLLSSPKQRKPRVLLIDDLRNLEANVIARDPIEGIRQLRLCGPWDVLLLDHDMATYEEDGTEITGYDVLLWLEEMIHTGKTHQGQTHALTISDRENLLPPSIRLVTDNASARTKMESAIKAIRQKMERLKRNEGRG